MADTPTNTPSSTRMTETPKRGASKMSLLLAFAAGAAFSWIIMQAADAKPLAPTAPNTLAR